MKDNYLKDMEELNLRANALSKVISLEARYNEDPSDILVLHDLRTSLAIATGVSLEGITGVAYGVAQFIKDAWSSFWEWVRSLIAKLYRRFKGEITVTLGELIKLNDEVVFINKRMEQYKHADDYIAKKFKYPIPEYRGSLTTKLVNEFSYIDKLTKVLASATNHLADSSHFVENLLQHNDLKMLGELTKQTQQGLQGDVNKIVSRVKARDNTIWYDKYEADSSTILKKVGKVSITKKHDALSPGNLKTIANLTLPYNNYTYIEEFGKIFKSLHRVINLASSSNINNIDQDTLDRIIKSTTWLVNVTNMLANLSQSTLNAQVTPMKILKKTGMVKALGYDLNKEGYIKAILS